MIDVNGNISVISGDINLKKISQTKIRKSLGSVNN